uniref:Uncharacterized protein n=1 Tax=Anguilla anguilla TaxID=7936 RepID=A0A0E9W2B3_ANGAN
MMHRQSLSSHNFTEFVDLYLYLLF